MEGTFDVQRDHVSLIRDTLDLLEPDGILIFSNNLRRFRMAAEKLPGVRITDISRATLPPDFERNPHPQLLAHRASRRGQRLRPGPSRVRALSQGCQPGTHLHALTLVPRLV